MLDPVTSLAFEMHASKGMFALLVGSGISRDAKIPTGWEITLELVSRLAALKGADTKGDPAAWYKETTGEDPDYSKLLNLLATTPTQRQQLIRPFIEPNENERERGEKRPTQAHRAIAQLMARGYVRVVVTTNFDRLIEQALSDLGLHASVLSSTDHIAGAVPLVHAGPTVIKVHGDYLDTRIKNTTDELAGYSPELNRLLDRVFDEYGLVVCGWSADWDVALKSAIDRAPARRFPTYWASRGTSSEAAVTLMQRRSARPIQISGADAFFDELEQKLRGIEVLSRPHPLSSTLAVAMLKEYVAEPRHRIRLHDLVYGERNRLLQALAAMKPDLQSFTPENFTAQVEQYEALVANLVALAYNAGIWCEGEQVRFWIDAVKTLAERRRNAGGVTVFIDLLAYPAALLLHAYLLGAVVGSRPKEFGALVAASIDVGGPEEKIASGDRLNMSCLITDGGQERFKLLAEQKDKKVAASERVANVLRPIARGELASELAFDNAFARVEMALSIGFAERRSPPATERYFWSPVGRFCYQGRIRATVLEEWREDFSVRGSQSAISMMAGLAKPPRFDDVARLANRAGLLF